MRRACVTRWLGRAALALCLLPAGYLLAALVLGLLVVQQPSFDMAQQGPDCPPAAQAMPPLDAQSAPAACGHTIYLASNGVHINLVLPLPATAQQARAWLPKRSHENGWMYVGWGSEAFYTQVPTGADLTLPIAARALLRDRSVLWVRPGAAPERAAWPHGVPLVLSAAQYARLVDDIDAQFAERRPLAGQDAGFYPAHGHYTPWLTCNEWVRQRLYGIGVAVPVWSPFDRALLWRVQAGHEK